MNNKYLSSSSNIVGLISGIITCIQTWRDISKGLTLEVIFHNPLFYITLLFLALSILLYFLHRKAEKQRKIIEELIIKNNENINKKNIANLNGHELTFTHLKSQLSELYNNPVELTLFSISNTIENNAGDRKNSKVCMNLKGECTNTSLSFKFAITGHYLVKADDIKISAYDNATGKDLIVTAKHYGTKNEVKEFTISYEEKNPKDAFDLTIKWVWPKMLELNDDFITLPNFYSTSTTKIKLELILNRSQTCEIAKIYKYSTEMAKPLHICDIKKTNGSFVFELNNPDKNTDYILYYK